MNGHDDDEMLVYGPQGDDEWQQRQADDDAALLDYLDTLYWFLSDTH